VPSVAPALDDLPTGAGLLGQISGYSYRAASAIEVETSP
jgi:hypothetical protein